MRKIITLLAIACVVGMTSCKKEFQRYEGPTQIAFGEATFSFNVTATTKTIEVPINLISKAPQSAIEASIAVNAAATNCASAVTVPTKATIDAGRFLSKIVIPVNHAALGKTNTLVLELSSTIPVAENFRKTTITLVKK